MKIRLLLFCMIPLLAGCASHRTCQLKKLATQPVPYHENILFGAKAFNCSDSIAYLDRDVVSAGYTPIQLAIKNKSQAYLEFTTDKINLKTIPAQIVAESVYFSVMNRALGYGIPGLLLCWPLLIPAAVDSINAADANEKLLRDYIEKSMQDKTIIPDSELGGLIFVSNNEYKNKIEVVLIDRDTLEKIICMAYL